MNPLIVQRTDIGKPTVTPLKSGHPGTYIACVTIPFLVPRDSTVHGSRLRGTPSHQIDVTQLEVDRCRSYLWFDPVGGVRYSEQTLLSWTRCLLSAQNFRLF